MQPNQPNRELELALTLGLIIFCLLASCLVIRYWSVLSYIDDQCVQSGCHLD